MIDTILGDIHIKIITNYNHYHICDLLCLNVLRNDWKLLVFMSHDNNQVYSKMKI